MYFLINYYEVCITYIVVIIMKISRQKHNNLDILMFYRETIVKLNLGTIQRSLFAE